MPNLSEQTSGESAAVPTANAADVNDSIEQLTASLQELTSRTYCQSHGFETASGEVSAADLEVSKEVESFIEMTRAYAEKTRSVSVGTY